MPSFWIRARMTEIHWRFRENHHFNLSLWSFLHSRIYSWPTLKYSWRKNYIRGCFEAALMQIRRTLSFSMRSRMTEFHRRFGEDHNFYLSLRSFLHYHISSGTALKCALRIDHTRGYNVAALEHARRISSFSIRARKTEFHRRFGKDRNFYLWPRSFLRFRTFFRPSLKCAGSNDDVTAYTKNALKQVRWVPSFWIRAQMTKSTDDSVKIATIIFPFGRSCGAAYCSGRL